MLLITLTFPQILGFYESYLERRVIVHSTWTRPGAHAEGLHFISMTTRCKHYLNTPALNPLQTHNNLAAAESRLFNNTPFQLKLKLSNYTKEKFKFLEHD